MLSSDIIFLICEQLRLSRDLGTLFQCSLATKGFAAAALPNLWRIHELASFNTNDEKSNVEMCMTLWRSLILSSFPGSTYAPYLHYIRVLSLREFENLLDERYFRITGRRHFFDGKLEQFSGPSKAISQKMSMYELEWGPVMRKISLAVGNHITEYCDTIQKQTGRRSVLEELDCNIVPTEALQGIIPRITGLRTLRLWDGSYLKDVAPLIRAHCPNFESLTMYYWEADTVDEDFAEFLRDLQSQTLKHLQVLSSLNSDVPTAMAALSTQNTSLISFTLGSDYEDFVYSLPLIGACSHLSLLHVDLGNRGVLGSKESLEEISNWLCTCTSLTDLKLTQKLSDFWPEVLVPVLLSSIRLNRLHLVCLNGDSAQGFHGALTGQAESLEHLTLVGDSDNVDTDVLVTSLSKLTKLQELHVANVSNYFLDRHIILLASSLPLLQELAVGGWNITDSVWPALSRLQFLRRLDLSTFSSFSLRAILGYIDCLGEGNRGLVLSIIGQDPFYPISQAEQDSAQDALTVKVDGRFEFVPGRDPNAPSDSESDSE